MSRFARAFLVLLLALVLQPSEADAQACANGGDYRIRLRPASIDYGPVSLQDLDNGLILMGTMRVRVRPRGGANQDWNLCIQAATPVFGAGVKPIGDVEWQLRGAGTWQPTTTGEQFVAQGSGRQNVFVDFRILVAWADPPGDYDAPLTFLVGGQ